MTTYNRPRPVSDLLPGLTKGVFGSKNMLFGKMLAEWSQIAGDGIAAQCVPVELKFQRKQEGPKGAGQAILHLAVRPAFALELSYQKSLLMERLNIFFGYPAIKDIRIIQNSNIMDKKKKGMHKSRPVTVEKQADIDRIVGSIQENDLQTALKNLGKAIVSRQNGDD